MAWLCRWAADRLSKEQPAGAIEARLPEPVIFGQENFDPGSRTWAYIRNWALVYIRDARAKNDNIRLDAAQTAGIRGEIKAMKAVIAIGDPKIGLLETAEREFGY